jgi:hypothetical protein
LNKQTIARMLAAAVGVYLTVSIFGFAAIGSRYPEAKYNERINGLIAAYILPCAVIGSSVGLIAADILLGAGKRKFRAKQSAHSLEAIAHEQLKRHNITDREIEAWGTLLSLSEEHKERL